MDTCGAQDQLNTSPGEHKAGILCRLVSEKDNALLANLIGNESTVLTAAVVQVFFALPEDRSQWALCHHGVVCFIRDHGLRSYFLRVFNIKAQKLVWEQELYFEFRYNTPRPYLHTFPGDNFQVALNFADEAEAENLKLFIEARIKRLQKIRNKKAVEARFTAGKHEEELTDRGGNVSTASTDTPHVPEKAGQPTRTK